MEQEMLIFPFNLKGKQGVNIKFDQSIKSINLMYIWVSSYFNIEFWNISQACYWKMLSVLILMIYIWHRDSCLFDCTLFLLLLMVGDCYSLSMLSPSWLFFFFFFGPMFLSSCGPKGTRSHITKFPLYLNRFSCSVTAHTGDYWDCLSACDWCQPRTREAEPAGKPRVSGQKPEWLWSAIQSDRYCSERSAPCHADTQ